MPIDVATVRLWGSEIGAVAWNADRDVATFEYMPAFQESGIELAPFMMPLGPAIHSFPNLAAETFYGLPGMLADALPDKFGNLLIDAWLQRSGRSSESFSPVERLCYMGRRSMGALEFEPALRQRPDKSEAIDVAQLVKLAADALAQKESLQSRFSGEAKGDVAAMQEILRVGTSAGGARAKAVIAWNEATGEVRSGQVEAPSGFGYWLLKFDGVAGNRDKELEDPRGYGLIEFAYYQMAVAAGIEMSPCRIFCENGRNHFMTKRFDRTDDGEKVFMQSLCALGHFDFNQAGAHSYEQAIEIAERLGVGRAEREQLFRRSVFNILARNQDDHTKNIAFLMDKGGQWRLSPAFDVTYSYNPDGPWTSQHQMTLQGKRKEFTIADFEATAARFRLFRGKRLRELLYSVDEAIGNWKEFGAQAGLSTKAIDEIAANHRRVDQMPKA
ncbi:type II toxin-antitoxin system HipA family toxin [Blastopirellula retiformator]|uniref:Putative DNA-binding transcriptional regulator n=1 Tax=Blastopirellula retiformator TaxID=2527970 RepID=A0A5C5V3A1_9BACT|nr:type II toxin-antitoxin system HipA family toxin [Blastopirellula retiformator]TWT32861.1 putative DNA-binding transcriptional regulator [Blastopirellula retiformator]